ncbi:hypothetical protein [Bacillus sp. Brlt_9]|uniref:hypothetical protein n=1 Tax=Bacillus sp. Brlt_9 TaxID=3110916 RepID=UPI003F7BFC09
MIKETTLMSNRYKFEHLVIEVLERVGENVCAFSATFVHIGVNDKMSKGHIEINRTLWNQQSNKRPKGFWILRTVKKDDGTSTTVLVSDEWFYKQLSKEQRDVFEERLDKEIGVRTN